MIRLAKLLDWIDDKVIRHRIYFVCQAVAEFYCWADRERDEIDFCICNIEWGCGENGTSVCGIDCPKHPPYGRCPDCNKRTFANMRCWKCTEKK